MNNDNIIGLNSKSTEPETKPEPTFNYTVSFRDGTTAEALGYLVIGHDFYGVARGEGVLYDIWPKELILGVHNNGPVSTTLQ